MIRIFTHLAQIFSHHKATSRARMLVGVFVVANAMHLSAEEPRFEPLVPGIQIQRLPVTLTNIDSVEYGPEGRLYAAGYDGRIHVLRDTDGDGLEDKAEVFWDKAGDLLTPVGILPTQDGVYVAARGKVALIKDSDGDGVGDHSEAVVSGWVKEVNNSDTRNDAAGIALDQQGNLYFSLGCMSYSEAWRLDDDGKSNYDKRSERGAILKVSADRKDREVMATGLRFVVGLDFNKHGDLFATDQEGDTWFPGGNPRDELLHIIPGRHYGFPFRHPKYLPTTIDEPSVVDFSPQHQSTCGFRFNESRANRKPFGPKQWEGNAIVTGFSRGKLWRTAIAKTRAGYVGKQIQFAAFESLLTDVAISPTGDLLVTGHSGRPDWGAGPAADGYLYKISFDRSAPQPVVAWPASPIEVKVAFDQPIRKDQLQDPSIEMGKFVWEGDQHEWIWPGYEVVKAAKAAVRRPLKVKQVSVSADGRTVTYTTLPHAWRSRYRITQPGIAAEPSRDQATGTTIELSYSLGGVQAEWTREGESKPAWTGWLPHVDTNVIRALTTGSADHDRLARLLQTPGKMSLRSQLLLPGKSVTLRLEGSGPFEVSCNGEAHPSISTEQHFEAVWHTDSQSASDAVNGTRSSRGGREEVLPTNTVPFSMVIQTGKGNEPFALSASYHADFDSNERPLRLEHLFVPWAPELLPPTTDLTAGWSGGPVAGDPEKGRALFFGKEANCASCHSFAGQGGKVAADLTVSLHRDPEAVMRDIIKPSVSINPDYVSYTVLTIDGRALTGLFQSADEKQITLVDNNAQTHTILRDEIEDIRASSVSLMPSGFEQLGKENLQDLVAFLCTEDAKSKREGLPTGVIRRDYWLNVAGSGIEDLTSHKDFPAKPTGTELLTRFEGPVNGEEHYGAKFYGYVHPPQTGDYTFWIAADDQAELWLSTNESPRQKQRILKLDRWTRTRDWDAYTEQKSKQIRLEAGKRYYIEALHYEATVDDCLAIGWELPDGTKERPIPGQRLSSPSGE